MSYESSALVAASLLGPELKHMMMARAKQASLDDDALQGIRKLKQLLEEPAEFEKWANETLDMSRLRKR